MRSSRGDAGFSLIEVLVAVSIVAITLVVFVAGMSTSFMASDFHRKQAVTSAGIRNFAEAVKAAPFSTNCATLAATYAKAYSPPPPSRRSSAGGATNSVSHVAPALTPASGGTMLVAFFAVSTGTTVTAPAGMTPGWSFHSNSATATSQVSLVFADQRLTTQAPTGTKTAISSLAANSTAQLVSIQPVASPTSLVRRAFSYNATPAGGGTTLTLSSPASTAVGDGLFAQIAVRNTAAAVSPPPGWTLINAKTQGSSVKSLIYEKTAASAGTTQFQWSFGGVTEAGGGIVGYAGVSKSYIARVNPDPAHPIQVWDRTATPPGWGPCPDAPEANDTQRVTLQLESTDRRAVQQIEIVKRCHDKPTPLDVCQDAP